MNQIEITGISYYKKEKQKEDKIIEKRKFPKLTINNSSQLEIKLFYWTKRKHNKMTDDDESENFYRKLKRICIDAEFYMDMDMDNLFNLKSNDNGKVLYLRI